ncbi:MAG: hypothetical protein GY822_15715 [Deltaproteobacteria bacterium]|nr:hypothetical protein [Deltaproteobacteria bacterium]
MKALKKLFALVVVLLLFAAAGGAYFRSSVLYSLQEMAAAGESGDLARLEKVVDLDSWAKVGVDFSASYAKATLKRTGGALGGIVGSLASAFLEGTKDATYPDVAAKAREQIQKGGAFKKIGPWIPEEGIAAVDTVEVKGDLAYVTLKGTCEGEPAPARILFHRLSGEGPLGLLDNWRTSGMEPADLQRVVDACVRADAKKEAQP